MSINADEIKGYVAGHFRYDKQCALIAFEAGDNCSSWGEPADVLVVTDARLLYEIEVKISISDLKHDMVKRKHTYFANGNEKHAVNRFYFAVPKEIAEEALSIIEKMYPYAGLLSVRGGFVDHKKQARILHTKKLSFRQIYELTRQQSGTLCRLSQALSSSNKIAAERWEEIKLLRQNLTLTKAENDTLKQSKTTISLEPHEPDMVLVWGGPGEGFKWETPTEIKG
jgi:hypothetical protein